MTTIYQQIQSAKKQWAISKRWNLIVKILEQIKDVSDLFDQMLKTMKAFTKPNNKFLEVVEDVLLHSLSEFQKNIDQSQEKNIKTQMEKIKKIKDKEAKEREKEQKEADTYDFNT